MPRAARLSVLWGRAMARKRTTAVTVRLDPDELAVLRRVPAESDAARLRALIHQDGLADALAARVARQVSEALARSDAAVVARIDEALVDRLNALDKEQRRRDKIILDAVGGKRQAPSGGSKK